MVKQHTNSLDIWQCSQKVHNIGYLQNVQHWYPENKHLLLHYKKLWDRCSCTSNWHKGCHGYSVVSAAWLGGISFGLVLWPVQVALHLWRFVWWGSAWAICPDCVCVCVRVKETLWAWKNGWIKRMDGWGTANWAESSQRGLTVTISDLFFFSFFSPQLIKVHDNTKTTSQDLHLLIHRHRIYRIQAFFQARNLSKAQGIS